MVGTIIYEVGIIIYEVGIIICDIGTINVRFYPLEVRYPHGYRRITQCIIYGIRNGYDACVFNVDESYNTKI